jgi:hypothetical protein
LGIKTILVALRATSIEPPSRLLVEHEVPLLPKLSGRRLLNNHQVLAI